jgi:hypothetical protein
MAAAGIIRYDPHAISGTYDTRVSVTSLLYVSLLKPAITVTEETIIQLLRDVIDVLE